VRPIGPGSGNYLRDDNNYSKKPRYLEAFTENNLPRYDWGPKKRINHFGLYAHLNTTESNEKMTLNGLRKPGTNSYFNKSFQDDHIPDDIPGDIETNVETERL
jgi:hypothetical protein